MSPARIHGAQSGRLPTPLLALFAVVGLILGLFVLLLFTPAGVIKMALERSSAEARLLAPSGRVHRGSGQLLIGNQNLGEVSWQLRAGALWRGRLEVDLSLRGPGYQAVGQGRLSPNRQSITGIEGRLDETALRALLAPYEIYPSGHLTFTEGQLTAQRQVLTDAHGDGHWSGGFVRYFLAGQGWSVTFPPLDARLRLVDGQPLLVVLDPAGHELLDLRLDLEGWAHLRVRYRFVAMAGFPWPDGPAPDTILFELSERVL